MADNNQLLLALPSNKIQMDQVTRPLAHYHPSVWGDYFLTYSSQPKEVDTQEWLEHQKLKEEVKNMLVEIPHIISSQKLDLINKIQRLGVGYQFEKEIEDSFKHIFKAYDEFNAEEDDNDLYVVALRFRLLRQEGYPVSANVAFEKFMDCDGKFKESLVSNVEAILSLYEASHLRVHEEQILEEALTFTTSHLESMLPNLTNPLRSQVSEALKKPIRRRLVRLDAQKFISAYEPDGERDTLLLKFAKLDFNLLQKEHQRELSSLTRWWKGLDVPNKLPFVRDRLVECYFWILGVYFEPKYSLARKFLTKVIAMTSIVDDTYDSYGTLDELKLFNDAVQRWDASGVNELPEYMRSPYIYLLDAFAEMEKELADKGESYRVNYAKFEMKKLVGAYFEEAKRYRDSRNITLEEYLKVAIVSCGYLMLSTTSLVGMEEDFVSKEVFDWAINEPLIARSAAIICRLMDDPAGHEFEQQRGHLDSSVEICMKQYGKSKEEVTKELLEGVTKAWKDINQECLMPTVFPMPILIRPLNLARVMDLLYSEGDLYTHSKTKLKDFIASTLVNPIL